MVLKPDLLRGGDSGFHCPELQVVSQGSGPWGRAETDGSGHGVVEEVESY